MHFLRRMSKHLKAISLGSMALAAVGAIGWGVWHFHESRSMKTDDCRVEASIVSVGSKPAECVTSVDVEEGENVRRGQTLAHLDSRIMQARLMAARSRVKLMQARHDEMLAGFRPQEVESQRARAVQASTSLEHARRDYERIEKLVREEAGISSADRDARTGVLPGGAGGSRHAAPGATAGFLRRAGCGLSAADGGGGLLLHQCAHVGGKVPHHPSRPRLL